MVGLDPRECIAARDALKQGNLAEAARLLLTGKHPHHRAVRRLLGETGRRLTAAAQQHFQAGELEAAEAALELAARCTALEGEALILQRQVAQALQQQRQRKAWAAQQLDQARKLADEGRLQTALDVLAALDADDAALVRREVEQRLSQFQRQVEACRCALQAGQPEAAYRHWQQAKAIAPPHPELAELAARVAQALSPAHGSSERPLPVCDRSQLVVLDDLALVVSAAEVGLGTPRAEGVHVPLQGPLHGRHAVLLRDGQGWRLAPCRDRHGQVCPVWVGGRPVADLCRLDDGCLIQLGHGGSTWRFRLPVAGSATAVLELAPGCRPCVWTGRRLLGRVVLLEQELWLRPAPPAHVVVPELPCRQWGLRWQQGRLGWVVDGGIVRVEFPGRTLELPESQLLLPCRLILQPQLDEAEWLGREVAGCPPADQLVLQLALPAAPAEQFRSEAPHGFRNASGPGDDGQA